MASESRLPPALLKALSPPNSPRSECRTDFDAALSEKDPGTTVKKGQRSALKFGKRRSMELVDSWLHGISDKFGDTDHIPSLSGTMALAAASAFGCYALRLVIRDSMEEFRWFQNLVRGKRLTVELYVLGAIHGMAWSIFSARKFASGQWDNPSGVTRALSLSAGFHMHELITLRSLIFRDPMMLIHHVLQLIMHSSMLRCPRTHWFAPTLMSHIASNAPLSLIRILRVVDFHPGRNVMRMLLGAYAAVFVITKSIGVPTLCVWNWLWDKKPEFHVRRYLPVKVSFALTYVLHHKWFVQALRGATEVMQFSGEDVTLHQLREIALEPLGRNFAAIGFVGFFATYLVAPVSLPLILILLRGRRKRFAFSYLGIIVALALAPLPKKAPAWVLKSAFVNAFLNLFKRYFNFSSVQETAFEKERRYLCAVFPHGIFPVGMFMSTQDFISQGFFPNTVGASVLFQLPVLRQLLSWTGGVAATKQNLNKCLQRSYPHNITFLVPGGIGEMFYMRPDLEHILSDHKGFVKTALQNGADIVPVYYLGHTHIFDIAGGFVGRMCEKFSRWARTSILLWQGRWGMPFVPHQRDMVALVGRPIPIEDAVPEPSKEMIDAYHARFCRELATLFHKHKGLCPGYEDKELYFGSDADVPPPPRLELEEMTQSKL